MFYDSELTSVLTTSTATDCSLVFQLVLTKSVLLSAYRYIVENSKHLPLIKCETLQFLAQILTPTHTCEIKGPLSSGHHFYMTVIPWQWRPISGTFTTTHWLSLRSSHAQQSFPINVDNEENDNADGPFSVTSRRCCWPVSVLQVDARVLLSKQSSEEWMGPLCRRDLKKNDCGQVGREIAVDHPWSRLIKGWMMKELVLSELFLDGLVSKHISQYLDYHIFKFKSI